MVENLPQLGSLALTVAGTQEKLQKGTEIGVNFNFPTNVPGFALPDSITTKVIESKSGKLMHIAGVSDDEVLAATLLLELEKLEKGAGTEITHTLELDYRVSTIKRKAAEIAFRLPLDLEVKEFSKQHIANIVAHLEASSRVPVTRGKKQIEPVLGSAAA